MQKRTRLPQARREHPSLTLRTSAIMTRKKAAPPPAGTETIAIDPSEPVRMKDLGGANSDRWNGRLINDLAAAIPGGLAPEQVRNFVPNLPVLSQLLRRAVQPVIACCCRQECAVGAPQVRWRIRAPWRP